MEKEYKLMLLKKDMQMTTKANDEYLDFLLSKAKELMEREGIREEDTNEYAGIQIDYAAYLFRKRASAQTAMPRFLRWEMNNLLISQKARQK